MAMWKQLEAIPSPTGHPTPTLTEGAHVRRIREKFRETDPDFNAIRAEYGMGYRWLEN